jgi:hypothetical protein
VGIKNTFFLFFFSLTNNIWILCVPRICEMVLQRVMKRGRTNQILPLLLLELLRLLVLGHLGDGVEIESARRKGVSREWRTDGRPCEELEIIIPYCFVVLRFPQHVFLTV